MQTIKNAANTSVLALGMGVIALAASAVQAGPNDLDLKIGAVSCGTVTLQFLDLNSKVVQLGSFIGNGNCSEFGEGSGQAGSGPVDPAPVDPAPVDPTPVVPGAGAVAGGVSGVGWKGAVFPQVQQSYQYINDKNSAGQATKYVYYRIEPNAFSGVDYIGNLSVVTTTSSANAVFTTWISATPGGEPVGDRCEKPLGFETIISWSTSYKKAPKSTCKIDYPNTYYLNVSDRTYGELIAGKSGSCKNNTRGCEFTLGVNSSKQ